MSKFIVSTDLDDYSYLSNVKLSSLQCKHIMYISPSTIRNYISALRVNYYNIIWGVYRNGTIDSERRIIEKMISNNFMHCTRIVITDNYIWADNTHSVISYILRGYKYVSEIPHYIVDLRGKIPKLVGLEDNIDWNKDSITDAIRRAQRLKVLEENNGRLNSWTISDLMKQIDYVVDEV